MDFENMTALSDEAIALISPEDEPEMEDTNEDVELEDIEYGDDYETEPDDEYEDDYEDNDEYEEEGEEEVPEDEEELEGDDDYIEELEIEGIGTVSIDDIVEWRQGNLRQADYTRKTQELAKQRDEMKDALSVYNYLKANPYLLTNIANGQQVSDPNLSQMMSEDKQMLRDLYYNQKAMEIERQVDHLRDKYGEVDEIALYNKAKELNTDDLEFVYKSIAYDNNGNTGIDENAMREQIRQEILADLEKNRNAVKTVVSSRQVSPQNKVRSLSADEMRVAEGLGLKPSEYAKWRD